MTLRECVAQALRDNGLSQASAVSIRFNDGTSIDVHSSNDSRLDQTVVGAAPEVKVRSSSQAGR